MKIGYILAIAFCASFSSFVTAQCNILPDDCSTACSLGTLPLPTPCSVDSASPIGSVLTFQLSNIGATTSANGSLCAFPTADVWYSFVATGTQLALNITSGTLVAPNVSIYQGTDCDSLIGLTCLTGSGGVLNQTFSPLTPGTTYYLQISGANVLDQGNFTLNISNNLECENCLLGESFTATPPPTNGIYKPGETVSFCLTVTDYNKTALNWLHGVVLYFGSGWDTTTLTPTYIPPSCAQVAGAHWGFYRRDSSWISHMVWGAGFYYETTAGSLTGVIDTIPGNNYGDAGVGSACPVTFCWKITTDSNSTAGSDLSVKVKTTGDSQSGSWTSPGCESDAVEGIGATLSACSTPVITTINTSCGASNGVVIAQGVGAPPYQYVWQNSLGDTISNLSKVYGADTIGHLSPGQYFLNVTDSTGCAKIGVALIGGQKDTFSITSVPVSCSGNPSPNGQITVTPLVPQNAPFLYSINGASFQSNNTFRKLSAGPYTIVTENTFGCFDTLMVTISQPTAISIVNSTATQATCNSGAYIKVMATGGTGALLYSWSNAGTGDSIGNLAGATYILTVTDQNSCAITDTFIVKTAVNAISFNNPLIINDSCNGTKNGGITATPTGGTGTLHYSWSVNSDTTAIIAGLAAGPYSLTVTDGAGCSASVTYLLQQPAVITVDSINIVPVHCLVNGSIQVLATGGTGSYTYSWNGNRSGDSIVNLAAGNYFLTVLDHNGCSATSTYTVGTATNNFTLSTPSISNVTCNGVNNGQITATTTGGAGKIKFQWSISNQDTTATISNLTPGNYLVTATDANGCRAIAEYAVATPPAITLGSVSITPSGCNQGGSIVIAAFGGTGLLTYSWSDARSGDSIANLAGGDYILTVTDQNLCSITATYHVDAANGVVTFADPVIANLKCFGNHNASITANAQGGNGPIHYLWNNQATGNKITGLGAGIYDVTVTDSVGCSASVAYFITEPSAITISNPIIVPAACTTGGSITITVSGGTGALSVNWSNGATGDSIINIAGDYYSITVTDQNSCTDTISFSLPSSQGGIVLNSHVTSLSCNGANDGSITLSPTGGAAGEKNYHWNPAEGNTDSLFNLRAGTYRVTVTDTGICSATASYVVTQPATLNINLSYSKVICFGSFLEPCTITVTGGNGGYTYNWSDGETSATADSLVAGTFKVTVTDSRNCSDTVSGNIYQDQQVYYSNLYNLSLCAVPPYADVTMQGRGGTGSYNFYLLGVDTNTTGSFPKLPPGNYSFIVFDSVGCDVADVFTIPQGVGSATFTLLPVPASCYGFTNGEIIVTPTTTPVGSLIYSINEGNAQADSVFNNLAAGEYTITIEDTAAHCTYDTTTTITQPPAVPLNISPNPDTLTAGKKTDTVTVSTGFTDPVFNWSPGNGLNCASCGTMVVGPDSSTDYYLKVYATGDSGCYEIDTLVVIVIPEAIPDSLVMPTAFTPNGDNINDVFGPVKGLSYFADLVVKEFKVYNRFGQLIHNSTDDWDGKFKGTEQPVGTYPYYIEVQYPDPNNTSKLKTVKMQGAVTLLR